jgi:hypothetical protein
MRNHEQIVVRLAEAIKAHFAKEIQPLRERIVELEARSRDAMRFRGAFQRAMHYIKGDFVTSDGAGWVCLRAIDGADGKPGADETAGAWQLAVKSR